MHRSLPLAILILVVHPSIGQRLDWLTHTSAHGSNLVPFMAVDPEGNSIMAAEYSGSITISGETFGSLGLEDILIAKFDTAGVLLWADHLGCSSDDWINDIGTDADGNIYIAVHASGFVTSYSALDTTLTLSSVEDRNLLIKISPQGEFLKETRSDDGWAFDVAGTELYTVRGVVPGGLFLERLDQDLQLLSSVPLGNVELIQPTIDVNPAGHIVLAGSEFYTDSMSVQGILVPNDPIDANEAFVMLLDLSGNVQWIRSFGGESNMWGEHAFGAAVDDAGRVYVATACDTSFVFAADTFPGVSGYVPPNGFLLAYDPSGNEEWAIPAYSTAYVGIFYDVIVDADGNVISTAQVFGAGRVNGLDLPLIARPYCVLKTDSNGNTIWLKHPMPESQQMDSPVFALGLGPDGAIYGCGFGRYYDLDCLDLPFEPNWTYFVLRIVEEPPVVPEASFSWVDVGLDVQFTDASTNATGWDWDFGDGGSSALTSPFHTFPGNGTYVVELTASYGICTDTYSDSLTLFSTGQVEGATGSGLYVTAGAGSIEIQLASGVPAEVQVIDAMGRIVVRHQAGPDPFIVPLSRGVYSVVCDAHGGRATRRIVVH